MTRESPAGIVSALSAGTRGAFRGRDAAARGVARSQLTRLLADGVIARELPDTYRMTAVARTTEVVLQAALLWAGDNAAAAARRSAGWWYRLEGIHAPSTPELVLLRGRRSHSPHIVAQRPENERALMIRSHRGLRVTGVEATLVALAASLDNEMLEVACEDARRQGLASVPSLRAYLDRFGARGRPGVASMRALLRGLDPQHPSASTLEVKTRRLLAARGLSDFVREFSLDGRRFDFAVPSARVILETNGRRWHTDPLDFEDDNEKWSVPARHGYRVVFATWRRVVEDPAGLLRELHATLAG